MCRILCIPLSLDKYLQPLKGYFHWGHSTYLRLLVVAKAFMWGAALCPQPFLASGCSVPLDPLS